MQLSNAKSDGSYIAEILGWGSYVLHRCIKIQWTSAYLIAMRPDHGRIGEMAVHVSHELYIGHTSRH